MRGLCYTRSEERVREQERTLQSIVKALFVNQLPAGRWAARGSWTSRDKISVCRCPPELGVPRAPCRERTASGYRRTDFLNPALGDGRRGKGEINYVCFDVSHQRKLKLLLLGNGCVQEEA